MSENVPAPKTERPTTRRSLLDGSKFALGLVIGGTLVLILCIWLSIAQTSEPKDNTLIGVIIGGFLAGSFSLIATVLSNYFMIRDSNDRRVDELEKVAASCFQKLHSTRDTMVKAYRHYFDGSSANVIRYGAQNEPMRQLPKPLAFSKIDRRLSDDELSLALSLKEVSLFNSLSELDSFVSNFNSLSDAYLSQFNHLQEIMLRSPDTNFEGRSATSTGVAVHPIDILAVEDLRDHLLECVRGGMPLAADAHSEMIDVMRRHFGRKIEFIEDPHMTGHVSFADKPRSD